MKKYILILIGLCFYFTSIGQIERDILRDSVVNISIDSRAKWVLSIKFLDEIDVILPDTQLIPKADSITFDTVIVPGYIDTVYSYFVKEFTLKDKLRNYLNTLYNIYIQEISASTTIINKYNSEIDELNQLLIIERRKRQRAARQANSFRNLVLANF